MAKIILFEENKEQKCVIRFVKGFRKKNWFRKARVEYSVSDSDVYKFESEAHIPEFVMERIKRDFPNAMIRIIDLVDFFYGDYKLQRFWTIARYNDGAEDYYCGNDIWKMPRYTEDFSEVRMMLSQTSAEETLRTIQATTRDRVYVRQLYINLKNELLTPVMMIICTSRGNGLTKYFSKLDGNRVRLCSTSVAARKFTYEEVLREYEYLRTHNKSYLYAVLPIFKDNVNCKDIEDYMEKHKISRMVAIDLQLKHLNGQSRAYGNNQES